MPGLALVGRSCLPICYRPTRVAAACGAGLLACCRPTLELLLVGLVLACLLQTHWSWCLWGMPACLLRKCPGACVCGARLPACVLQVPWGLCLWGMHGACLLQTHYSWGLWGMHACLLQTHWLWHLWGMPACLLQTHCAWCLWGMPACLTFSQRQR